MGLYDEHHEFSPILIPISTRMDELRVTYRIYMQSGEVHEVRANSAAEAVEALGISEGILRIANAAHEARAMLDSNLLNPNGMAIATDITLTETTKTLLVVEDSVTQQLKDEFTAFNLVDYADATGRKRPQSSQETSANTPSAISENNATKAPTEALSAIEQEYMDYLTDDVDYIEIAPAEEPPVPTAPAKAATPTTPQAKPQVADELYSIDDKIAKMYAEDASSSEKSLSPEEVRNLLASNNT